MTWNWKSLMTNIILQSYYNKYLNFLLWVCSSSGQFMYLGHVRRGECCSSYFNISPKSLEFIKPFHHMFIIDSRIDLWQKKFHERGSHRVETIYFSYFFRRIMPFWIIKISSICHKRNNSIIYVLDWIIHGI